MWDPSLMVGLGNVLRKKLIISSHNVDYEACNKLLTNNSLKHYEASYQLSTRFL